MQVRAAAGRVGRHPQAHRVALLLILLLAFTLRVWNINWDQDQHLHPDERFWNIITDAVGTFFAIITMFLLLRMECTGKK